MSKIDDAYVRKAFAPVKKALLTLIIATAFLNLPFFASAHGGEDHGDEAKAPVASLGQMNAKTARVKDLDILFKYPTPKFGEETPLRIFVTDAKNNAPIPGVNVSMIFNYEGKTHNTNAGAVGANAATVQAAAAPTQTPGVYEGKVTFFDYGKYDVVLTLAGSDINEQVTINEIVVPEKPADEANAKNARTTLPILILLIIVFTAAAAAGYFFLLRPSRSRKAAAAAWEQTAYD